MPHTPHNFTRARRRPLAAVVAVAIGLFVVPFGADAAPRTSSEAIAVEAERALYSLDRWQDSKNPADYVRFVQGRAATASLAAADLELDAIELAAAWADVSASKQHAVLAAMSQLGVPYKNLASEPGVGFDCSGLTIWAFEAAGVELPRVSRDQIDDSEVIDRELAEPGDLVYYPGHIGIYLGLENYIHSPNSGADVMISQVPSKSSLRFGDAVVEIDASSLLVDRSVTVSQ